MKDDGASLIEAHAETPASRGQFGVFEVERLLGEGAFSEVYLARAPGGGAPVAVKVLREDVDPRVKEQVRLRFLSEERIAKHIGHRAIADVVETGCTPTGRFFIVMEYVDGQPFGEYFEGRGRAEEASGSTLGRERLLFELARVGHQVAEAMASAHQRGVVHRDLKSENVLVTTPCEAGELPRARILDFGIAKAPADVFSVAQARSFTRYFTDLGTVMGSPPYMAPEQNGAAHAVTGKADVFALGVMLFIAALRLDHRAIEAFQQPLALPDDFDRLIGAGPPLPKAWRELLRAMLRLEADERPSMHEVALRLQRLARPDVEVAIAVERFTRKGQLPGARRLCALAARMEREAYLTDDERSFLRVAPIEKLRRGSSPATGIALLAITGTLCFAAGSLDAIPGISLRSLATLTALTAPAPQRQPATNVVAAVQPRADDEKQRLSAELERARAELAQRTTADGERAGALTACQDKLARCESNAERAGERSRTLASELEERTNAVGRAQREADAEAETASNCQRELAAKTQELAESADRLRLCTRSLREQEDGAAPKVLGLSR